MLTAIRIKLSEKYTAANQKRIGTFIVTRKWNFVNEKTAQIAEKFDPKGNIYEIAKSVSRPKELNKISNMEVKPNPEIAAKLAKQKLAKQRKLKKKK